MNCAFSCYCHLWPSLHYGWLASHGQSCLCPDGPYSKGNTTGCLSLVISTSLYHNDYFWSFFSRFYFVWYWYRLAEMIQSLCCSLLKLYFWNKRTRVGVTCYGIWYKDAWECLKVQSSLGECWGKKVPRVHGWVGGQMKFNLVHTPYRKQYLKQNCLRVIWLTYL